MAIIYKITNHLNNKCYIGQTVQEPNIRWKQHIKPKKYKCAIYSAILKYGLENFTFEIVEKTKPELLDEKEIYYIRKYNSYRNGYNLTKGGEGCKGCTRKRKYEDIIPDLYVDLKSTRKIADKLNISIITVRTILKERSLFKYRKKNSFDYKIKSVEQLDLLGKTINVYNSITEACLAIGKTNKNVSEISKCCKGKRTSAYGYKWKYK